MTAPIQQFVPGLLPPGWEVQALQEVRDPMFARQLLFHFMAANDIHSINFKGKAYRCVKEMPDDVAIELADREASKMISEALREEGRLN